MVLVSHVRSVWHISRTGRSIVSVYSSGNGGEMSSRMVDAWSSQALFQYTQMRAVFDCPICHSIVASVFHVLQERSDLLLVRGSQPVTGSSRIFRPACKTSH